MLVGTPFNDSVRGKGMEMGIENGKGIGREWEKKGKGKFGQPPLLRYSKSALFEAFQ